MINIIIKELIFFTILVTVLAFIQHGDLLSDPLERFSLMQEKGNYLHPFLWVGIVYAVLLILRLVLKFILITLKKRT